MSVRLRQVSALEAVLVAAAPRPPSNEDSPPAAGLWLGGLRRSFVTVQAAVGTLPWSRNDAISRSEKAASVLRRYGDGGGAARRRSGTEAHRHRRRRHHRCEPCLPPGEARRGGDARRAHAARQRRDRELVCLDQCHVFKAAV